MELEGFATGFNNPPKDPGFSIENEDFRISFTGVLCDDTKNIVSHGFEVFYDWTEVMKLMLAATNNFEVLSDIEEVTEDSLRHWMTTFQGWGLLSSLLPTERHRHFILALAYTSSNWDERTGGPYSAEKIFDTVKFVYDNIKGKELRTLMPSLGVWFEEISMDPEVSFKGEINERKKQIVLFFRAKWTLEVKFLLEKKRVNKCLVDLSSEALAKMINHEEQMRLLEVPLTLFPVLERKYRDAAWVRSYWDYMDDENLDKIEVDSKAGTIEDSDLSDLEIDIADAEEALIYDVSEELGNEKENNIYIEDSIIASPFVQIQDTNNKVISDHSIKNTDSSDVTHWWVLYAVLFVLTYLSS